METAGTRLSIAIIYSAIARFLFAFMTPTGSAAISNYYYYLVASYNYSIPCSCAGSVMWCKRWTNIAISNFIARKRGGRWSMELGELIKN